jgi:steroid delta-isomerase-like uncharacterized protein
MGLRSIARQEVVRVSPQTSVAEAARLMEQKKVGSVVISDNGKPKGLLTDRDVTLRVLGKGMDPLKTPVEQVMTQDLVTLREDMGLLEALEAAKDKPIRRFLVVDSKDRLVGIFTLDDVLYLLGREMADVARIVEHEMPEAPTLPEERHAAVLRRFIEECWNQGKLEALAECITPGYTHHTLLRPDPVTGLEANKAWITQMRTAFPDLNYRIEEIFASGDRVFIRWSATGTHKGEFAGIRPTNKKVEFSGSFHCRCENGKLAEGWAYPDAYGLMKQIGAIPS